MNLFFLCLKVLNQDETPFLYSVVFGEGVVNDATSIVLFNAVQSIDFSNIDATISLKLLGTFLYLFFSSTILGIVVSQQIWTFGCFSYWKKNSMNMAKFEVSTLRASINPKFLNANVSGWTFKCFYHKNALLWKVSMPSFRFAKAC